MTFDDKFQWVIAGLSFYGCTTQTSPYREPANRSQINEVMCSPFIEVVDCVEHVGMATVH